MAQSRRMQLQHGEVHAHVLGQVAQEEAEDHRSGGSGASSLRAQNATLTAALEDSRKEMGKMLDQVCTPACLPVCLAHHATVRCTAPLGAIRAPTLPPSPQDCAWRLACCMHSRDSQVSFRIWRGSSAM